MDTNVYRKLLDDILSSLPPDLNIGISELIIHNKSTSGEHRGFYITKKYGPHLGYLNITDGGIYIYRASRGRITSNTRILLADPYFKYKTLNALHENIGNIKWL